MWSLLEGDRWWRHSWRKLFPTFLETALLKDGLNQMILHCWFLFLWFLLVLLNFSLKSAYPLSLRAFSYGYLDELKTSSLEEFLDKRSLIIFGNWLIICGGWFEDLLKYNNKSLGFYNNKSFVRSVCATVWVERGVYKIYNFKILYRYKHIKYKLSICVFYQFCIYVFL